MESQYTTMFDDISGLFSTYGLSLVIALVVGYILYRFLGLGTIAVIIVGLIVFGLGPEAYDIAVSVLARIEEAVRSV